MENFPKQSRIDDAAKVGKYLRAKYNKEGKLQFGEAALSNIAKAPSGYRYLINLPIAGPEAVLRNWLRSLGRNESEFDYAYTAENVKSGQRYHDAWVRAVAAANAVPKQQTDLDATFKMIADIPPKAKMEVVKVDGGQSGSPRSHRKTTAVEQYDRMIKTHGSDRSYYLDITPLEKASEVKGKPTNKLSEKTRKIKIDEPRVATSTRAALESFLRMWQAAGKSVNRDAVLQEFEDKRARSQTEKSSSKKKESAPGVAAAPTILPSKVTSPRTNSPPRSAAPTSPRLGSPSRSAVPPTTGGIPAPTRRG